MKIENYVKVAIRNLKKRKGFALINIFSLALGITGGIFMMVFAIDELSFDRFHTNGDRIYRVNSLFRDVKTGEEGYNSTNAWPIGKVLAADFPEVEKVVYIANWPQMDLYQNKKRFDHRMFFASKEMLEVFSFGLKKGNAETALQEPYQVVLSEELADKFFPGEDALNQELMLEDSIPLRVSGVVENVPQNSHIQFDFLVSFATLEALTQMQYEEGWGNFNLHNYVLLREGADAAAFSQKTKSLYMDRMGDMYKSWGSEVLLLLESMRDIYLKSESGNGLGNIGSMDRLWLVIGICSFAMLLACINFTNLSTARSMDRAKEVGLRKVVGSSRSGLVFQFLAEAFVLTFLAFLLAVLLANLLMPFFNELLGKNYTLSALGSLEVILGLTLLLVLITFFAGFYPAIALSAMQPVKVLKGKFTASTSGLQLRRGLVVLQFFISATLLMGTIVVLDQLQFMQQKNLGFDKDQILVLNTNRIPSSKVAALKSELQQLTSVRVVSFANGIPGRPGWIGQIAYPEGREKDNPTSVEYLAVDEDYVKTLGLELVAGRDFDTNRVTDLGEGLILNEKAVTLFGWSSPEEAIGKRVVSPSTTPQGVVIGVVKDYHQLGVQQNIHGIAMDVAPQHAYRLVVKFDPAQSIGLLEQIEGKWESLFGKEDFQYFFLNEDFDRLYQSEVRLSKMFNLFALATFMISIVGLLGLVSYMIQTRNKELGIRKILGAGRGQVVALLSKDFILLVGIAALLAAPTVAYLSSKWLADFAFQTELPLGAFALVVLGTVGITLMLVAAQAIQAYYSNTMQALKSE
jgi:putative ABC transport system permease protein